MPDPKRRSLSLLPEAPSLGAVNLPQGDGTGVDASVEDFVRGLMGDQKPGELDSALGAMAGILPIGRILGALGLMKHTPKAAQAAAPARRALGMADDVGDAIYDEAGRLIAPPQTHIKPRPAGPWDQNRPR